MYDSDTLESLDAVAVIGMAGRFPGAKNIGEFWRNLRGGVESVTRFSDAELEAAGVSPALLREPRYVRSGAVLEDVEYFDAAFFGYNAREAELMDPQHRVFLECAWEALEDAGYDPAAFRLPVGVFAGVSTNTYLLSNLYSKRDLVASVDTFQAMIFNDKDFLPIQVSYRLNLKGPSINVQTACSTSLVAVHLACQSLLGGECDLVLAGGASVNVPQKTGYLYQEGGINSPDGHCRAFDEQARGTFKGSGAGLVVLKRLADALADGDRIRAVIRGSAVNNDGAAKVGYTAPGIDGQAEVVAAAHAVAAVEAGSITYVEAHGTATPLGDPIEITALTQAFRATTQEKNFCAVGSVKTNIGHLDAAAGVAGLIKTVLSLEHRELPASLHFERPNPEIDFAGSPFFVNAELRAWAAGETPRRAGVSSFGIGGTNAHVVLEEAPQPEPSRAARPAHLLVLSARSESALDAATANLAAHLASHPDESLPDVAYTLQVGRRAFGHRRALVCRATAEAAEALRGWAARREPGTPASSDRPVVFMFPGQGTQHAGMGRGLYDDEPVFRQQLDACAELLAPHLGLDLRQALYPEPGQAEAAGARLHETWLAQPALFAVTYALAQTWLAWGVRPRAMIGHSVGEYAAGCLAGVFKLEDALALVATRGRLMQQTADGAMLAVSASEAEAEAYLGGRLSLAAVNGTQQCVISGPTPAIEELRRRLGREGKAAQRLKTSHAFHSELMRQAVESFAGAVRGCRLDTPRLPFVSNVTGTWITPEEATDPGYWASHLLRTVRFADGLREVLADGEGALLEVGPGGALGALARRHPACGPGRVIEASLPRLGSAPEADYPHALEALGRLWCAGVRPDWAGLRAGERRRRVPLPTYPFERQRYWVEPREEEPAPGRGYAALERKADLADWFYIPSWKRTMPPAPFVAGQLAGRQASWLIFTDACGLGMRLAGLLEREGQEVFTVAQGGRFERRGPRAFAVSPGRREDYDALLGELSSRGAAPDEVVHLWNVTPEDESPAAESGRRFEETGFYSLLFLAQALGDLGPESPVRICVVADGLHEVVGGEVVRPEKATLLGPCRAIPHEYAGITCRNLDFALDGAAAADGELAALLAAEILQTRAEATVAYRGGHRLTQSFEAVRLGDAAGRNARLREGGVYLITGGLGGVGLVLAEHLARKARARLVLVGRRGVPPRGEWEQWLAARAEQDEVSLRIRKLQAIEALGAEVLALEADVADEGRMRAAVLLARERFGQINGVIHAAGVAPEGLMQLKTRQAAERVLAPKVRGTRVLEAIFRGAGLDFLVLCSSLSAIVSGIGTVDHCAANAFLDAFASYSRNGGDAFTISVNWDTWREVGQAVNAWVPEELRAWREESIRRGISPAEGATAFDRLLAHSTLPQVLVATVDYREFIEQINAHTIAGALEATAREGGGRAAAAAPAAASDAATRAAARPAPAGGLVAPRNEVEREVAAIWQELLGVERVGADSDFFELGGHSLLVTQLASRLRRAFRVELPLRAVYEAPTVAGMAAVVAGKLAGQADGELMAELLAEMAQLTDEEVQARLDARDADRDARPLPA